MNAPESMPAEVVAGIERYARQHALIACELVERLEWDGLMGCYYLEQFGQYVGIELNGYVHT